MHHLLTVLFRFIDSASDARRIKKDPELKRKCKKFGVQSILFSIFAIPFALLILVSVAWLQGDGMLLLIFIIALPIIGAIGMLLMLVDAIAYFILQICVNRRLISWLALVFLVASVVGCALLSLSALGVWGSLVS